LEQQIAEAKRRIQEEVSAALSKAQQEQKKAEEKLEDLNIITPTSSKLMKKL